MKKVATRLFQVGSSSQLRRRAPLPASMQIASVWPSALFLAAVMLGILVAANVSTYFGAPEHELGDLAVNALQIDHAKGGLELLGNYSRFRFHHPGPGFFYVYAVGELVLCDWLHVVPTPHAAHMLAGATLQCLCFGLGVAIFAAYSRRRLLPFLVLPLAALHFGWSTYAFASIWPPHAPVMPFFCFLVASCAVAAGGVRQLPIAVASGGLLVHGHVAQPLFVLPMLSLAYAQAWWRHRREGGQGLLREFPLVHAVALVLGALLLLPIAIDASRGANSNAAQILGHLLRSGGDRKSFEQSLLFLLSFFGYKLDQPRLIAAAEGFTRLWRESGVQLTAHAVLALLVVALLVRLRRRTSAGLAPLDQWRFLRSAAIYWCLAGAGCLQWGMMQSGEMFEFNGHFYFGWIFVLWTLGVAFVPGLPARVPLPLAAVVLIGLAAVLGAKSLVLPVSMDRAADVPGAVRALMAVDPTPATKKFLRFDTESWAVVAGAATALHREGVRFAVDPSWAYAFGEHRALSWPPNSRHLEETSCGGSCVERQEAQGSRSATCR